jgi:hypothetical protein
MFARLVNRLSAVIVTFVLTVSSMGVYAYANAGQPAPPVTATVVTDYARLQPTLVSTLPTDTGALEAHGQLKTDPFIRSELFFGSERPNKPEVSDVEFKLFLDEEITPRFPDGLTVLKGFGQFREAGGTIVQESSFVLILLYPQETLRESSVKIEEIRALYLKRFEQESVLRVDDPRPVRVSF